MCRIDWDIAHAEKTGPPDARIVAFDGSMCNCRGRIVYKGKEIASLIISSAC